MCIAGVSVMRRKIIIFITSFVCFSFMAYGMDEKDGQKNNTFPQTSIQITDDVTHPRLEKRSPVPNILIASSNASNASSSRNVIKTRVKSVKELEGLLEKTTDTHRTARGTPPVHRAGPKNLLRVSVSDDDDPVPTSAVPNNPVKRSKNTFLPQSLTSDVIAKITDQSVDVIFAITSDVSDCGKIERLTGLFGTAEVGTGSSSSLTLTLNKF